MLSIEQREAQWRKHLEEQTRDYETFDRNLSDKVSFHKTENEEGPSMVTKSLSEKKDKKEKKEKKEGDDKKDKKDKKEKKDKKGFDPPTRIGDPTPTRIGEAPPTKIGETPPTRIGGARPLEENEEEIPMSTRTSENLTTLVEEMADHQDGCHANLETPAENRVQTCMDCSVASTASQGPAAKRVHRCGNLTWTDLIHATRTLLQKTGRVPASEFLENWLKEYGYALTFPFFGFEDLTTLLLELQPAALSVVMKKGTVIAASSDGAFAKESSNPSRSQDLRQSGTASEWMVASLEKELKVVRQSINERRRAQKDAEAQVEKIRQEYQRVQGQKSAHSRGLKDDITKHEKRVSKFREEAEAFETKEKALVAQIIAEKNAAEALPELGTKAPEVPEAIHKTPNRKAPVEALMQTTSDRDVDEANFM